MITRLSSMPSRLDSSLMASLWLVSRLHLEAFRWLLWRWRWLQCLILLEFDELLGAFGGLHRRSLWWMIPLVHLILCIALRIKFLHIFSKTSSHSQSQLDKNCNWISFWICSTYVYFSFLYYDNKQKMMEDWKISRKCCIWRRQLESVKFMFPTIKAASEAEREDDAQEINSIAPIINLVREINKYLYDDWRRNRLYFDKHIRT